ncbi:hypothetical protein ACS0TY_023280 [Phlomoides rotata]
MIKARIAEEDEDEMEKDLLKAFKVFDLNGDGYICCDELQSKDVGFSSSSGATSIPIPAPDFK